MAVRRLQLALLTVLMLATTASHSLAVRFPDKTHNLLLDATISGNMGSFQKGLRGTPNDVLFDLQKKKFKVDSFYHEYGVGFQQNMGVVAEKSPAWWMAEWDKPVRANRIVLSGAYPNQPQPNTARSVEVRTQEGWKTIDRGIGGWYYSGRFEWGGPGTEPLEFDALRLNLFSKDDKSTISSIHIRGEEGTSWVVAEVPRVDASLRPLAWPVRAGVPIEFAAGQKYGEIKSWRWNFGGGQTAAGRSVRHAFPRPGSYTVQLSVSDGVDKACFSQAVKVESALNAQIKPLEHAVLAGKPVEWIGNAQGDGEKSFHWDFGDGNKANGKSVQHVFVQPGVRLVRLTVAAGNDRDECLALVRVHSPQTLGTPQLLLDTDAMNEVDDQHYISYGLFSDLDILGVNSIHHGGGQEPTNYKEILHIVDLALKSGLSPHRKPLVFHGANHRLAVPESGKWQDTIPEVTPASEAILAAARGASPENPVDVLPVGPCTNVACALLQAHAEGLDLKGRLRVIGLIGGAKSGSEGTFNGANDPWSVYVVAHSGIEFWALLESPTGASLRFDKRLEGDLYPNNVLGDYLKKITPPHNKSLFDVATIAMVIGERGNKGWLTQVEPSTILGPDKHYFWAPPAGPTNLRVIRDIDEEAMKADFFKVLNQSTQRPKPKK